MSIDLKKAFSYGVLLWIVMFVVVSAFVGFKVWDFKSIQILTAIFSGIIAYVLAGKIGVSDFKSAVSFSVVLVASCLILDFIVTTKFNPGIFSDWIYWLSTALVFVSPFIKIKK